MTRYSEELMYNGNSYKFGQKPPVPPVQLLPLCLTANEGWCEVCLQQFGSPQYVELETSRDGASWTDYAINDTITLSSIGDKVYFRNKSETPTLFSTNLNDAYGFVLNGGSVSASGDATSLLCKHGTNTLSACCFAGLFYECPTLTTAPELSATILASDCYNNMFRSCTSLTTPPRLPATTLANACYQQMFNYCSGLTTLPELPATTLPALCYNYMFGGCSNIKLSETQTGEYQTPYRIPSSGTGSSSPYAWGGSMFSYTGGTFTGDPQINTTYYTSNQVI